MNRLIRLPLAAAIAAGIFPPALAATYHAAPDGSPENAGTADAPWDLASAWAGQRGLAPGDTLLLKGGVYRHPDRTWNSAGFALALEGTPEAPIHIRPVAGERVTIDGKVEVKPDSRDLRVWDLEITVSETAGWDRRVTAGGLEIDGTAILPQGGLNILGGSGSKFINLVIHTMNSGVGFWRGALDAEMHGCLIHNVGSIGPDRYHGPGIYTQNESGTKRLTDNILFGNYSTTIQAYGSKNASVNGFEIIGNIAFAPLKAGHREQVLVGGGKPSRDITVRENILHEVPLQIGYTAPHNENAVVRDNRVINAGMSINNYRRVEESGNVILAASAPRPDRAAEVVLRPNRYQPGRANVAILNWPRAATVAVDLAPLLKPGARFRIVSALDFFGPPVVAGTFDGSPVAVPVPVEERTGQGEFCAFVVLPDGP